MDPFLTHADQRRAQVLIAEPAQRLGRHLPQLAGHPAVEPLFVISW